MECMRMLDEHGLRPIPAIVALRLWERAFLYSCHFFRAQEGRGEPPYRPTGRRPRQHGYVGGR